VSGLWAAGAGAQVVDIRLVGAPWWLIALVLAATILRLTLGFLNDRLLIGRGSKHMKAWAEVEKQRRRSTLRGLRRPR